MTILDFFRKKKENFVVQETRVFPFSKIGDLAEGELNSLSHQSEDFKKELIKDANEFCMEIKEKIPKLKSFSLEKRREHERLKETVMENLAFYTEHLEKFMGDLTNLEKEKDVKEYIIKTQIVFNNFSKNSKGSFERATILIGKELGDVRDILKDFARNFSKKLEENKKLFEKVELIKKIKSELRESEELNEISFEIGNEIKSNERKILELAKEKQTTEKWLEDYLKSEKHLNFIKESEKIEQERKEIDRIIMDAKQKLNLRELAKFFHNDKKKSEIIKDYAENFEESIGKDKNLEIAWLAKQAKIEVNDEELRTLQERVLSKKESSEELDVKDIENKIRSIVHESAEKIRDVENIKEKAKKMKERMQEKIVQIKEEAKKIFPDVVLGD